MKIVDRFTNLEYGKVRYSITGEASDNLVVLMHGLTTSKDIYNNLTRDLIEQGFQVLSFDYLTARNHQKHPALSSLLTGPYYSSDPTRDPFAWRTI